MRAFNSLASQPGFFLVRMRVREGGSFIMHAPSLPGIAIL